MKLFLKIINKFSYAFQGLKEGILHDKSIQLQVLLGSVVVLVCLPLALSLMEWVIIVAMILLVLAAEFLNSALEELVDIVCPTYDIRAKRIKDFGAAMVLLISMLAAVVGLYIIGGKLL